MPETRGELRAYRAQELRELMDNVGGWARRWDDVLMYLEGPARQDAVFATRPIPALRSDVEALRNADFRFTRDYRKIWQKLTGEDADHLPPPAHADPHAIDPLEVQKDYLADLAFPSDKRGVLKAARINNAPTHVMDRIEALDDRIYRNRDELLENLDDASWHTP